MPATFTFFVASNDKEVREAGIFYFFIVKRWRWVVYLKSEHSICPVSFPSVLIILRTVFCCCFFFGVGIVKVKCVDVSE